MTKQELRLQMREAFKLHKDENGAEIWDRIEALPEFTGAHTILIYMALPDEVPTQGFIDRWNGTKRFVIPQVRGLDLGLKEYDPERLAPGYRDISEPTDEALDVRPEEIDLALIPGVAFDRKGHRMGRGKGFYDRFLPALHCPTVAVCQRWRIVESVPTDPWDRTIDIILHP